MAVRIFISLNQIFELDPRKVVAEFNQLGVKGVYSDFQKTIDQFTRGKIKADTVLKRFNETFGCNLSYKEFTNAWSQGLTTNPSAVAFLEKIRKAQYSYEIKVNLLSDYDSILQRVAEQALKKEIPDFDWPEHQFKSIELRLTKEEFVKTVLSSFQKTRNYELEQKCLLLIPPKAPKLNWYQKLFGLVGIQTDAEFVYQQQEKHNQWLQNHARQNQIEILKSDDVTKLYSLLDAKDKLNLPNVGLEKSKTMVPAKKLQSKRKTINQAVSKSSQESTSKELSPC